MDQGLLFGQTNFDEYNQIFWYLESIANELGQGPDAGWIDLRLLQLTEWVRAGNVLIVVGVMPVWVQALGSDLSTQEPFRGINFQTAGGTRIEVCGPQSARELLAELSKDMAYDYVLSGGQLNPLLRVRTANKDGPIQMVAGIRTLDVGHIIYLPRLKGYPTDWTKALAAIQRLPAVLTRREPDELPEWVNDFHSEPERDATASIRSLQAEVACIEDEISRHNLVLNDAASLKQLIAGSGQAFADAAATALRELGFRVVEGQHPRADLVVSDGRRIAAVEVKGVGGPIAENYLRQLRAWMTEIDHILSLPPEERSYEQMDYAATIEKLETPVADLDCKGLLIVGTFRKTPLDQRSEPDLPDAAQRRLGGTDICILTGQQLMGLVLAARRDPQIKPVLVRDIMSAQGRLDRALDWKEFLSPAMSVK